MKNTACIACLLVVVVACQEAPEPPAALTRTLSPEGARVYFQSPADGEVVAGPEVAVRFGLKGMGVAPAGIDFPGTGHHHLLVNASALPPIDLPIPADASHIHFGLGQTQAMVELPPGSHTLQLLLGDRNHVPHDPPVISDAITVTVE